jgi:hypothetical protein
MQLGVHSLLGSICLLLGSCAVPVEGQDAGINLPPAQGSSGTGAFIPGVYTYNYSREYVASLRSLGFNSIRLPINVATATDDASLAKLKSYIDGIGGRGVLCMFGTANSTTGTHGTGIVDDVGAATLAWSNVNSVFASYPNVKYEIFNEPRGYHNPSEYLSTMLRVVKDAGLPEERCIIAATGWEEFPAPLVQLGWKGSIGYHFYPWWIAEGSRTQQQFSNVLKRSTAGISTRTYITEFGADLNLPNHNYEQYDPSGSSGEVNCLRGLNDAVVELKNKGLGIKGAFHWHGRKNGDSYDIFAKANANGAAKVRKILFDAFSASDLFVM